MVSEITGWASLRGVEATRQSILLLLGFTQPTVLHFSIPVGTLTLFPPYTYISYLVEQAPHYYFLFPQSLNFLITQSPPSEGRNTCSFTNQPNTSPPLKLNCLILPHPLCIFYQLSIRYFGLFFVRRIVFITFRSY